MSAVNNDNENDGVLAIFIPGVGALLPDSDRTSESFIPLEELTKLSKLTQTSMEEILKPIIFPYWSL
jgi:hypothetical protein